MQPPLSLGGKLVGTTILACVTALVVGVAARPSSGGSAPPECSRLVDATSGMMRLQFARTPECAGALRAQWEHVKTRARVSLAADYLFIILYVAALTLFCRWLSAQGLGQRWRRVLRVAAAMAVVAGIFDAVENGALLGLLAGHTSGSWPLVAFISATAKFALIGIALATSCVAWVGAESALTPFLTTAITTSESSDSGSEPQGPFVTFLAYLWPSRVPILTCALLLYLGFGIANSRYLSGLLDPVAETALLPIALVALLCSWSATMVLCLVWAHGRERLLLPPATQPLTSAPGRVWLYGSAAAAPLLLAIVRYSSQWSDRSVGAMVFYAATGAITAALLLASTLRLSRWALTVAMLKKVGAPVRSILKVVNRAAFVRAGFLEGPHDAPQLRPGHGLAAFLAAVSVGTFAAVGFATRDVTNPQWASALLYVLLLALALTWMLGFVAFLLDRTRVPLLVYTLMWILLVDVACRRQTDLEYETYVVGGEIATGSAGAGLTVGAPAVPILIAASGGGIQSAGWTAQVLTGLADRIPQFSADLQLLSGVSGGSVGIMHFLTQEPPCGPEAGPEDRNHDNALRYATDSSLHAVGWGLVYQDFIRVFAPILTKPRVNRGLLMEDAWKRDPRLGAEVDAAKPDGSTALLSSWRRNVGEGTCPGVIFNAMVAETGEPMLFSTIALPRTLERFAFERHYPNLDVKLTTAVRLSATFPYVSPAVHAQHDADPRYAREVKPVNAEERVARFSHVVDGGYFDNFGVGTAAGWLDAALNELDKTARPKRVLVIEICESSACSSDDPGLTPAYGGEQRSWVYQLYAPVSALLAMRTSAQRARNRWHLSLLQERWRSEVCIETVTFPYTSAPGPMSWHLTERQKAEIRGAWVTNVATRSSADTVQRMLANAPDVNLRTGQPTCSTQPAQ